MVATSFDTLSFYNRLKSAGFTEQQAEVTTQAVWALVQDAFDARTYAKKLREAGFTNQQTETMIEAFNAVLQHNREVMHKQSEAA